MGSLVLVIGGTLLALGIALTAAASSQRQPIPWIRIGMVLVAGLVLTILAAAASSARDALSIASALVLAIVVAGLVAFLVRQWDQPEKARQNRTLLLLLGFAVAAVILRVLDTLAR